jgi:hypothetical protein
VPRRSGLEELRLTRAGLNGVDLGVDPPDRISSMTRFGDKSLFACLGLPRTILDPLKP